MMTLILDISLEWKKNIISPGRMQERGRQRLLRRPHSGRHKLTKKKPISSIMQMSKNPDGFRRKPVSLRPQVAMTTSNNSAFLLLLSIFLRSAETRSLLFRRSPLRLSTSTVTSSCPMKSGLSTSSRAAKGGEMTMHISPGFFDDGGSDLETLKVKLSLSPASVICFFPVAD